MPNKIRLLTPGPTTIPERIQRVMGMPILHHRSPEFKPIFKEAQTGLKKLFQTSQDVLLLSSSGTGAMESVIVNCFEPGEKICVIEGGKFGQRWGKLGQTFGLETLIIKIEWGAPVEIAQIEEVFQTHPDIKGIFLQGVETSTGVSHPVKEIASWCKQNKPECLVGIDGITSVGAAPMPMDEWGLDAVLTGSQKALMLPPGLAVVALSEKAWKKAFSVKGKIPKFYFDLDRELKAQRDQNTTAWTPAISLIIGLVEALRMMEEEGWDNLFRRHAHLAYATQEAGKALGLELLAPLAPSPSITAFKVPQDIDGEKLVKTMRDVYGYTLAGGQEHLKGKIFRMGHMGYVDAFDLVGAWGAVELTLKKLGWKKAPPFGTAPGAFLKAYESKV